MISSLSKLLVNISLIVVYLGVLTGITNLLLPYLPFTYLTYTFLFIRRISMVLNFMIDLNTLWILVGWMFKIQIILGSYYLYKYLVRMMKQY